MYPEFFNSISDYRNNRTKLQNISRIEKIFKLLPYLTEFRSKTDIGQYLNISPKSVYNYINLLVKLGFKIEYTWLCENEGKAYRLKKVR
jgi:biotin operon repressor